ncbi:NAD(P)-binding domain-containing protein [Numidum massiliense]|uniref:NAD(P)-binding domain-containing protein n=1 Tax=Numidum massiliense TaxID=1522315 RepID=UPI000A8EC857|nr:NAD(P)-binding domain-containing protein [Numidum massiliense]
MNILVIGTGYVGLTTGVVFAAQGFQVTGLDLDTAKIAALSQGKLYFYEEGLEKLLKTALQAGKIAFTTDAERAVTENDVIFLCVGTPQNPDGSANLDSVQQVARDIGRYMNGDKIVAIKSTVPVGTQEKVAQWISAAQQQKHTFSVASVPEFFAKGVRFKMRSIPIASSSGVPMNGQPLHLKKFIAG